MIEAQQRPLIDLPFFKCNNDAPSYCLGYLNFVFISNDCRSLPLAKATIHVI